MSKYTISMKVVLYEKREVEASNTQEAIKKASQEIKDQYSLLGDEISVTEIEEDFI